MKITATKTMEAWLPLSPLATLRADGQFAMLIADGIFDVFDAGVLANLHKPFKWFYILLNQFPVRVGLATEVIKITDLQHEGSIPAVGAGFVCSVQVVPLGAYR